MTDTPHIAEAPDATRTLSLSRRFAVPVERLYAAWTWQHEGQMQGLETFLDLKFTALDDGTSELRLTHTMLPNPEMAEGHTEGWQSAFECLDAFLAD